jgi:SAM-dependent methyltransferase
VSPTYAEVPRAEWTLQIPDASAEQLERLHTAIEAAASASQYGWGHSIDFGPFTQEGLLGDTWLAVAGALDRLELWPRTLEGMRVADVGAFSGGISALMAHRGAAAVYAVDELPGHARQAAVVADAFGLETVTVVESSLYRLDRHIAPGSLDLILLSGVLYHLSDMLVGLYALRRLLKPGGRLVLETNAVEDMEHSYANFGRFYAGMWWQPTMLCVKDMYEFMGFESVRVEPFVDSRCVAAGVAVAEDIPFKRGLHWDFEGRDDAVGRPMDRTVMAPAPPPAPEPPPSLLRRLLGRVIPRG